MLMPSKIMCYSQYWFQKHWPTYCAAA
ncbi:hypothetical protein BVI1335_320132 [Burkholderia vietnamiensis]|nr:hypothetical protein BVI1335_320132 [Burkholderia vietnamiensis]